MGAVTRGPMGLDFRVRGNDMGVDLVPKYRGCIFVTMRGKNRPAVIFHHLAETAVPFGYG